jgi:rare lipoprotein A (peptidoglycan hydrolase)
VPLDQKNLKKESVAKPDSEVKVPKESATTQTKTIRTATPVAADSTRIVRTASIAKNTDAKKTVSLNAGKARREVFENGVASWIRDDDINPNKYYALHRSAPIGTIIKVTNKMNNKYVFVKVVGSLPNTGDNTDLVIKISKASAEKLGVHDSKFQSELSYGVNEKP